jgi:hypothetical protein
VVTVPQVASEITIDGNPADNYGVNTDVDATFSHTVCFGPVAGFTPPACQSVTVKAGMPTVVTGTFTPCLTTCLGQTGVGFLRVTSSPAVPTQVLVDGHIADSWGLNWLEIAPGPHTVCFLHLEGWTEPSSCQSATVLAGVTSTVTGIFTQRGGIHVLTTPPVPATITIDGVARDTWGVYTDIPTGSHTVCFGSVPGHATTPACQTVTVNAGLETVAIGLYT